MIMPSSSRSDCTKRLRQMTINGAFMHFNLIALYGGPDQVMTVTSGIATIIGVLLIFWNKVVAGLFKLFGRSSKATSTATQQDPPTKPS
jgi:hypothetical protein